MKQRIKGKKYDTEKAVRVGAVCRRYRESLCFTPEGDWFLFNEDEAGDLKPQIHPLPEVEAIDWLIAHGATPEPERDESIGEAWL